MNINLETLEPIYQQMIERQIKTIDLVTLNIGDEIRISNEVLCNEKPYGKILDKFSNNKFKTAMKTISVLIDLEGKSVNNIFVIKLHPSYKIIPIIYDDFNLNYKLELCKKLLSFAKLYNRRLSNIHFRFELDSVGNLFSYHEKDILLLEKKNILKTTSYMHLVTNNAYKYTSHKTKLICIACNWKGIFKAHGRAEFETIDDCTLIVDDLQAVRFQEAKIRQK